MRKGARFWILFLLAGGAGIAAGIPELRPPEGLLGPTIWEQYGGRIVLGTLAGLGLLGLLVWRLRRAKPITPPLPATVARQALEAWRPRAEDNESVSGVSRVVRAYLREILQLPALELTADEWAATLASHPLPTRELTQMALEFLRDCDARLFAPRLPAPGDRVVERALQLVDAIESARQPASAPAVASQATRSVAAK